MKMSADPQRLAKVIARAGLCSRREAERWIAEGRIVVNAETVKTPAISVIPEDIILIDGQPMPAPQPSKLWRYHKPVGVVTTHDDPQGRPTLFQKVHDRVGHVISVGRLDLSSEGLILLTNDGELARHMELPATGWTRRYRVRAFGKINERAIEQVRHGLTIDGVRYDSIDIKLERSTTSNIWLLASLKEGKNREIRRVLEHIGLSVNRLIRVSYGPFHLGGLSPDGLAPVPPKVLREQLGKEPSIAHHRRSSSRPTS